MIRMKVTDGMGFIKYCLPFKSQVKSVDNVLLFAVRPKVSAFAKMVKVKFSRNFRQKRIPEANMSKQALERGDGNNEAMTKAVDEASTNDAIDAEQNAIDDQGERDNVNDNDSATNEVARGDQRKRHPRCEFFLFLSNFR